MPSAVALKEKFAAAIRLKIKPVFMDPTSIVGYTVHYRFASEKKKGRNKGKGKNA